MKVLNREKVERKRKVANLLSSSDDEIEAPVGKKKKMSGKEKTPVSEKVVSSSKNDKTEDGGTKKEMTKTQKANGQENELKDCVVVGSGLRGECFHEGEQAGRRIGEEEEAQVADGEKGVQPQAACSKEVFGQVPGAADFVSGAVHFETAADFVSGAVHFETAVLAAAKVHSSDVSGAAVRFAAAAAAVF